MYLSRFATLAQSLLYCIPSNFPGFRSQNLQSKVVLSTGECDRHCQRTAQSCKYKRSFKDPHMMLAHIQIILHVLVKTTKELFRDSCRSSSHSYLASREDLMIVWGSRISPLLLGAVLCSPVLGKHRGNTGMFTTKPAFLWSHLSLVLQYILCFSFNNPP